MPDPSESRFPRIAPILLIGVLVGLAVFRPAFVGGEPAVALFAVMMIGYIAWRFHGIPAAAGAITLLCLADPAKLGDLAVLVRPFVEQQCDTIFLATLAIGIAAASRQGKAGRWHWIIIAMMAVAIAIFGWFGLLMPEATDPVARDRLRHVMLGVTALSLVVGMLTRSATWLDRLKLLSATIGVPTAGIVAARLNHGTWPAIFEGGEWSVLFAEWKDAFANGSWYAGLWAWSVPWLVASLLLIGIWRTVMRGLKEWNQGRRPLAWVLTAASIGAFAAVGARLVASGSLLLAALGAILSVFGVADLIQSLVERIELRPPEPGPTDIPRVK